MTLCSSTGLYLLLLLLLLLLFCQGFSFTHSRITDLQGNGEGLFLTPHYHFHLLHRHLDINLAIATESSPLYVTSSRTRTGNLQFLSTSREPPSCVPLTSFHLLGKIIEVSHKGENMFFDFWALLKMLVVTFLLAQWFIQSTQCFSGSTYL